MKKVAVKIAQVSAPSTSNNDKAPATEKKADVLLPWMLEENASRDQTKWIDFAGVALSFFKRHVPNAPDGFARFVHLLRNVEGEAWILLKTDDEGNAYKLPEDSHEVNEVTILKRHYTTHVALAASKKDAKAHSVAGYLKDDKGNVTALVRCPDYDLKGQSK